jgi:ATP-dependent Clp protease protease subunit
MTKVTNWLSYSPRAAANEPATIQIFDQIGEDWFSNSGVTAKSFAETLQAVGPGPINVEINSPGGNVWDGLAIYNMLRGRQAAVTTKVVGVAASIASIIALAGDTVEIADAALMMIHDPSGIAAGTSEEMRKMADALDQHAAILAGVYEKKTGKTASAIRAAMRAETWFTSAEAIDFGLADSISEKQPAMQASAARAWVTASLSKLSTGSTSAVADGANTAPTSQTPHNMDNQTPPVVPAAPAAPAPAAPTAIDIEAIVAKAVAAAISAKAPTAAPAPEPVAPVLIQNLGNPLLEQHKKMKAGADRRKFLIENHSELIRQNRLIAPQNGNTFAAGLVVDYLADAVITEMATKLAMVGNFTRNVGLDNLRPRATVQVKKFVQAGASATVDNATNFETSNDSELAATAVTVNQISKLFTVTQQELNQGFALADLAAGSADVFALGISKKITAVMTSANYGAGTTIGTAANFDTSDLPAILALAKNYRQKLLLLDGGHLARLQFSAAANTFPDARYGPLNNGLFGFEAILEQNDWTGAIANTAGFVCGRDAIAIASGLPVGMIAGEFVEQRTVESTNGLSVLLSVWYSRATRAHMASYDIMFGVAAGDKTQAEVLITA